MRRISSRDNPGFKSLRELVENAREQRQRRQTLIDGLHLLDAYRQSGGVPGELLLAESAEGNAEIAALLAAYADVPRTVLRDALFRELSGVASPVGIAALIQIPDSADVIPQTSCVLLDAVQDSGNVGSILRTAAAAGITDVFMGTGCAGAWTPRVLRAAQGAHFALRIHEQQDLVSLLLRLPMPAIATVAHAGQPLYALDLSEAVAWLFGNEGAGLSPALLTAARFSARIPLAASESLNVAAAAAICLFEEVRQKQAR